MRNTQVVMSKKEKSRLERKLTPSKEIAQEMFDGDTDKAIEYIVKKSSKKELEYYLEYDLNDEEAKKAREIAELEELKSQVKAFLKQKNITAQEYINTPNPYSKKVLLQILITILGCLVILFGFKGLGMLFTDFDAYGIAKGVGGVFISLQALSIARNIREMVEINKS
ncbi:MAG: hypothetical protein IKB73_03995, partial [Ruminococcus sp.]|nr:hypothetical protein [Ruminococcus sp.]